MKYKHYVVFTVLFAFVALGISCSKPSEKKIFGTWQLTKEEHRDSDNSQWTFKDLVNDSFFYYFRINGTCVTNEGKECWWSLDNNGQTIIFDGIPYDIEEFSSKKMVWHYNGKPHLSESSEWYEERLTWEKPKKEKLK